MAMMKVEDQIGWDGKKSLDAIPLRKRDDTMLGRTRREE